MDAFLEEILRRVEATPAGVVVVPSRILRRVIKRDRAIPGIGLDVPHPSSYVVSRAALTAIATEAELRRSVDRLPASVILLPIPEDETSKDRSAILGRLWRVAFHASIHQALEERIASGALSPAVVRARVHQIGQTELDEVRLVLRQDDLLLPPHDATAVYVELAATALELIHFDPAQLTRTFPALVDVARLATILGADLDVPALLERCRPDGAPTVEAIAARARAESADHRPRSTGSFGKTPTPPPLRVISDEPPEITRKARAAEKRGNLVRAMLIRSRVGTRGEAGARQNLGTLAQRLARALEWPDAPTAEWVNLLFPLVPAAGRRTLPWNAESRLLYDLVRACLDYERELFTISVVEWALSFGNRPVRRPIPAQRELRLAKHLATASSRVDATNLEEEERDGIKALLGALERRAEANTRKALRPRIERALASVGLVAKNVPEHVSAHKLVEELIDHVVEHRFLTLGQLRDAISRNQVKLRTLRARELVSGDALLKLDRILATSLDGVHRRAEFYVRGLQKLSSIMFGTVPGRLLVLYLLLPVICAYVVLEGLQHVVGPLLSKIPHVEVPEIVSWQSIGIAAAVIFALIHSSIARMVTMRVLKIIGAIARFFLVRMPLWFWERKLVQAIVKSRPVQLFSRYVLKPLALSAVFYAVLPFLPIADWVGWTLAGVFFVVANVVLNSRFGALAEETATDWTVRTWRRLHRRILPGLFALVLTFFRRMIELMDRAIYAVDELLRFRSGEGRVSFAIKASLGILWFVVTYMVRLYVNLLVEPEINPIKHFPVVTVAAKLMIPISPTLHAAMSVPLNRLLGPFIGEAIAVSTVFVLPGFFGFLVWELKENWKIYEQNRSRELGPVVIGQHGETMIALMRPGLHSGTIPKIYAHLRRASQKGTEALLKQRAALAHVEEALRHFVERELIGLLDRAPSWNGGKLSVVEIVMASNRIRIALSCPSVNAKPVEVAFEEQSGWLLGTIADPGFVDALPEDQRIVFENALAGLYKVAGVDLVRERMSACVAGAPYDVMDEGLLVWPGGAWGTEVIYDLGGRGKLVPRKRAGDDARAKTAPTILARDLVFRLEPILWSDWVEAWKDATVRRLMSGTSLLPERSPVTAPQASGPPTVSEGAPPTVTEGAPPTVRDEKAEAETVPSR